MLLTQTGYREKFYNTAQSLFSLTQDLGDWVTKGLTVTVKGSFDAKNYNHLARTKTPPQYMASGRDEFGDLILQQKVIGADNLTLRRVAQRLPFGLPRSVGQLGALLRQARPLGAFPLPAVAAQQRGNRQVAARTGPSLPDQGIAGRITYSYDNRYFIEGNFGYNGSENFSPGKRFGFFPSVAAGYVISNEKFFEPVRGVIDLLKIKASYGIVGNDKIGTATTCAASSTTKRSFRATPTTSVRAPNPMPAHGSATGQTPTSVGKRRTNSTWASTCRCSAS